MPFVIESTLGSSMDAQKVVCYGATGVGKTTLIATAPSPFIISAERGLMPLRNLDLPKVEIRSIDTITEIWQWLMTPASSWVKTVCLDSLSDISETIFDQIMKETKNDGRRAYPEFRRRMLWLIKAYRDIPGKHIYMTCKEDKVKQPGGGLKYGCMTPWDKVGSDIPFFFDEVWRMGVGVTEQNQKYRFLQTQPSPEADAKDRSGVLAPIEINPDLSQIFAKIQGAR